MHTSDAFIKPSGDVFLKSGAPHLHVVVLVSEVLEGCREEPPAGVEAHHALRVAPKVLLLPGQLLPLQWDQLMAAG